MKIAFVHDWLQNMGGAEKVLEALLELYEGPIYTLVKGDLSTTPFAHRTVRPSYLQKLPFREKVFRSLLPLFPNAIESLDLSAYDCIFSSSYCVAKAVIRRPYQQHICYCHTPMRFAWDLHLYPMHPLKKALAKPLLKHLREYDRNTHHRVDHFIANSAHVAMRIKKYYGREAAVVHPPVAVDQFSIATAKEDYYITCSRLVPYKRVDLLLESFKASPKRRLIIVGEGPERKRLEKVAPQNVEFVGYLPIAEYSRMLSRARGFVYAAEEDFGIVLAEAQAAGVPVIAYGVGGSTEIVLPGTTGLFFQHQTPGAIIEALDRFEILENDLDPQVIRNNAQRFSKERFKREIQTFVNTKRKKYCLKVW